MVMHACQDDDRPRSAGSSEPVGLTRRPPKVLCSPVMSPDPTPFLAFSRSEWSALRASTPMTLNEDDIEAIRGINVELSIDEVERIYLPLSRLLNLYVKASQSLFSVTDTFLGKPTAPVPYVIGIAGSVAVGKSTSARVLQALLFALARPSPRGPGHHGRIPVAQRHPGGEGLDGAQGFSREL